MGVGGNGHVVMYYITTAVYNHKHVHGTCPAALQRRMLFFFFACLIVVVKQRNRFEKRGDMQKLIKLPTVHNDNFKIIVKVFRTKSNKIPRECHRNTVFFFFILGLQLKCVNFHWF